MKSQISNLKSARVAVLGLASTGRAVCRFLLREGATVLGLDQKDTLLMQEIVKPLVEAGVTVRLGPHRSEDFRGVDVLVLSPGVSISHPTIKEVSNRIPVWSEIELAYRHLKAPIIGVTGTNGKSTTTVLIGKILEAAGKRVFTGGNLGTPLIEAVGGSWDWIVCEISSFQLEAIREFRPKIGVFLNITDDHLDRHKDFNEYFDAKKRLFEHQRSEDFAVINLDDPLLADWARALSASLIGTSRLRSTSPGAFLRGDELVYGDTRVEESYPLAEANLKGVHNIENMLASIAAARLAFCPPDAIRSVLKTFQPLPHRMEWVGAVKGVDFYDDSKATNVGAVIRAIESMTPTTGEMPREGRSPERLTRKTVLILGGLDKGGDFGLIASQSDRIRHAVLIGQARQRLEEALRGRVETSPAGSMGEAVRSAWKSAEEGDAVLLSPACASFDMFKSYKDRGEQFCEAVRKLAAEVSASGREGSQARKTGSKPSDGGTAKSPKGVYEARMH
ncbi:MAG: UDP-N-acetylmuramoyl-L-alanine--D-glutamate ligase [Nitrospirae bacterium]|nr:UDP-N-acetylmuramoyl-L-alanine--D-glutamate ligase [Nitrospirota bacterium]